MQLLNIQIYNKKDYVFLTYSICSLRILLTFDEIFQTTKTLNSIY